MILFFSLLQQQNIKVIRITDNRLKKKKKKSCLACDLLELSAGPGADGRILDVLLCSLCISRRVSCRIVANTTTSTNASRVGYKSRATESTQTSSLASLGRGFDRRRRNAQFILRKFSLVASVWGSLTHRIAVVPVRSSAVCGTREERR